MQRITLMTTMTMHSPIRVNVKRADGTGARAMPKPMDLAADIERARIIADWLDTKYSVGGIRFGLDAIVGLVPVVGDLIGAAAGVYPIYVAQKHGLGKLVQLRMGANLAAEWAIGSVPLVGDLIDVGFKANVRNVGLLEKAAAKKGR